MEKTTIYLIIALSCSVPTLVASYLWYKNNLPKSTKPFLIGSILALLVLGASVGFVFLNIYAGLVLASILLPWLGMYLWFGYESVRLRYTQHNDEVTKKYNKKIDKEKNERN